MTNRGFAHDALADIAEIKDLLRDQYSSEAILKELIQNADDSDASEVHLGWLPGEPEAPHPLLRSPALLVLNNGLFRESDARGIRTLRLGAKAGDLKAIGKFGLGLKSVFHWCEAFFYLASSNQPGARGRPTFELLNPWGSSGFHNDWNEIEHVSQRLLDRLASWPHELGRWFCLWLPLRTKHLLDGKAPIVDEYPEAPAEIGDKAMVRIAEMLPLGRSVKRVVFWTPGARNSLEEVRRLSITEDSNRRAFPELPPGKRRPISGRIQAEQVGKLLWTLDFHGHEYVETHPSFEEFKQRDDWPTRPGIDETGRSTLQREKAKPHASVLLTKLPEAGGEGSLAVTHAVFLPLAEILERVQCRPGYRYHLLLHGYFFLDAGRIHIDRSNEWNRLLLERAVLPLVLPALDAFVNATPSRGDEAEALTRALSQTDLFESERERVCGDSRWIFRLEAAGGSWQLVRATEPFWTLPLHPRRAPEMPREVFPNLSRVITSRAITFEELPRLSASEPASWTARGSGDLASLLEIDASEIFSDAARLGYFIRFLEQEKRRANPSDWERTCPSLIALARRALFSADPQALFELDDPFQRFIGLLPEDSWIPSQALAQLLQSAQGRIAVAPVLKLNLNRLLLPASLAPQAAPAGYLRTEDTQRVLQTLEEALESAVDHPALLPPLGRLALELIDRTLGDHLERRRVIGSLRVIRIHDYRAGHERIVSWNELETLHREELLFAGAFTHAAALQGALAEASVSRLVEDRERLPSKVLFEANALRACDSHACIACLQRCPALSGPEERQDLLGKLLDRAESVSEDEHLSAVRFLLHAQRQHYTDVDLSLLSDAGTDHNSVWGKLARWALADRSREWRWVPSLLAQLVSPQQAMKLHLEVVGPTAAEDLLTQQGVGWVDPSRMTAAEREQVLRTIQDIDLWRNLPLHLTASGQFSAIGEGIFLDADVAVPPSLEGTITLLAPSSDPVLQALYRDRVALFDEERLVGEALALKSPARAEAHILDAVKNLGRVPSSIWGDLRSTPWLSTDDGNRAPEEVVDVPGLEEYLAQVLTTADHVSRLVSVGSIAPAAREHEAFRIIRRSLFLHTRAACDALGAALAEDPQYRIGPLNSSDLDGNGLSKLIDAFKGIPLEVSPALGVLRNIEGALSDIETVRILAGHLLGPVEPARLKGCLQALSERHQSSNRLDARTVLEVHAWYLTAIAGQEGFEPAVLSGLSLLSKSESWTEVEQLCLEAHGIRPTHLLCETQARILSPRIPSSSTASIAGGAKKATRDIEDAANTGPILEYLRRFEPFVAPEILGGFAALLGDEEKVRNAAADHLDPRWSLENFRQRIDWQVLLPPLTGAGEDVHDAMSRQRFLFRVSDSATSQTWSVTNLIGQRIDVPLSGDCEDLLVGQLRSSPGRGFRTYEVSLRALDPTAVSRLRLHELFLSTASVILDKVYCQTPGNLSSLWSELAESEQLDLEVAQRLVLEHALFYVRQLGEKDSDFFRRFGKRFDDLRYREAEIERLPADSEAQAELKAQKQELRDELSSCLREDPRAQGETLAAVRSKVADYQYEPSSIPFELFQNADDAASELREMLRRSEAPSQAGRMAVSWDESRIVFVYWGRPINQFRLAQFPGSEGRRLGYHRDLEKMLVMSSSDKSEQGNLVTGKFGLGFKSVFLFTDRPRVVSGRLGFEVLGGVFPEKLPSDDSQRLREHSDAYSRGSHETTVVELSRSDELGIEPHGVLDSFLELAHFLPVFSRLIKSFELHDRREAPEQLAWHEESLFGSERVFVGNLRPARQSSHQPGKAVVIRGAHGAALLLAVNSDGFAAFPKRTPTFWVTAPTRSFESAGLALNAPLLLDVGRGRLGAADGNLKVVCEFGTAMGAALIDLHDLSGDWDSLRAKLGLSPGLTRYAFWSSLWTIVSGRAFLGDGIEPQLLRAAFWSEQRGLRRLLEERDALPTELSGEYNTLTRLPEVRFAVRGELDSLAVFERALKIPALRSLAGPGELISGSRVAEKLEGLLGSRRRFAPIEMTNLLEAEIETGRNIDSLRASALGAVFNSDLVNSLERSQDGRREAEGIREILREFHFETEEGSFSAAQDLLMVSPESATPEERLRAGFAPPNRVLSESYDASGREFFRVCRSEMRAPTEMLVDWGIAATTDNQRRAFVEYLLNGQLANRVAFELRSRGSISWIESVRDSDLMAGLDGPHRLVLLGRIGFDEDRLASPESIPAICRDSRPILGRLHEWWRENRGTELAEYQQRIYPDGGAFLESLRNTGTQTAIQREAWLTLLLRASLETLGRFSDEQHREFIRLCTRRNWIKELAEDASPETFVNHIRGYVAHQADQIPFFHWLGQYSKLYIMAEWIEAYAHALLDVNLMASDPSLRTILTPRINPEYSGGGPDAPPLGPMLGIGSCFVLRELRRSGIITNPKIDPLCFVPNSALRSLIEAIGGPQISEDDAPEARSRAIWDFLADRIGEDYASFEGDFDIPLILLARRPDLREHLQK